MTQPQRKQVAVSCQKRTLFSQFLFQVSAYVCTITLTFCFHGTAQAEVSAQGARAPDRPVRTVPKFAADPAASSSVWTRVETVQMPELEVKSLRLQDLVADPNAPKRVGVNRALPVGVETTTHGLRSNEGGRAVWRFKVRDAGAQALRLKFDRFELPADGRLIVGDPAQRYSWEFGREAVRVDGTFWTPPIPGEEILIEYSASTLTADSPFRINSVSHLYAGGYDRRGCSVQPCHVDTACNAGVNSIARDSVGRMLYSSGASSFVCSGSLLNDSDDSNVIGYFLTANHCISTQSEATSLNVTYFYQATSCGGGEPNPASLPQTNGALLLATTTETDMTLLELFPGLPGGAGLAGWTTGVPADTETLTGIHHPAGCRKRVSVGNADSTPAVGPCSGLPLSNYHYGVWASGHTEGGSSGSPLFNESWQVVGQLYGKCWSGNTNCGTSGTNWNWVYGRFDQSFELLSPYINESGVWVEFTALGLIEFGTPIFPYDMLSEGVAAAESGGRVWIKSGATTETPTINKHVVLGAVGGPVIIGVQ